MKWLAKKRDEVIKLWRENKISYVEAFAQLVALGLSIDDAGRILAE